MAPEDETLDLASLLGGVGNAQNLQLLQILSLMNKDRKKGAAVGVGDILSEQGKRRAQMADSYAPGTKYEAGWEPGGVMDAIGRFMVQMGGGPMAIDESSRALNPQEIDTLGSSFEDALRMGLAIRDTEDQAGPYDDIISRLVQTLIPADPNAPGQSTGKKPATGALSGRTGDLDMGVGGTAVTPMNSIKPPLGKAGEAEGQRQSAAGMGFRPDATAALVAQILQRTAEPRATATPRRPRPNYGPKGPNYPNKIGGYEDGGAVSAPVSGSLIRVGERSPNDKKYATEEVILAPPGTIIAPVPKGMENPSHEDAMGLIMSQLLKNPDREVAPDTPPGHSVTKAKKLQGARSGLITSSASGGRQRAMEGALGLGNMLSSNKNQMLDRNLRERQMYINRDQGNRGMDIQRENNYWGYDLGLRNLSQRSREGDQNYNLGQERNRISQQELNLNFQRAQDELRNWEAERALKRELGMRGLDIDKQRADQDYQLSSAQMAFQQIMAGITGSALPGVRAGRTPMLGLLG